MDTDDEILRANRVMLVHFDSYSTALVFAKWSNTLLWPAPLGEGAAMTTAPAQPAPAQDGERVKALAISRLGLNAAEVVRADDFDQWVGTTDGPVRVHLLRFTTFEAPKAAIEPHDAVFRPISALRGSDALELMLAREVFNLIIGGGGAKG